MIRTFERGDLLALQTLLSSDQWPFHAPAIPSQDRDENYFNSVINRTLVYLDLDNNLRGYIRFYDIEDSDTDSPLFDIRVDASVRGQGIGTKLVHAGVQYIFETFSNIRRIEATTREDNVAMSKVLMAAGFVQEATYRKAWKVTDTKYMNALGYALLKEEFVL